MDENIHAGHREKMRARFIHDKGFENFEDHQILASESDDACDLSSDPVEFLSYRPCDSAADASADYAYLLDALCLCWVAEWAYEVLKIVSLHLAVKLLSSSTYYLEDDHYSALIRVCPRYRQWYPLTLFINSQDNKLTRFSLASYERSFHLDLSDCRLQGSPSYYFIHIISLL